MTGSALLFGLSWVVGAGWGCWGRLGATGAVLGCEVLAGVWLVLLCGSEVAAPGSVGPGGAEVCVGGLITPLGLGWRAVESIPPARLRQSLHSDTTYYVSLKLIYEHLKELASWTRRSA